MTEDLHIKPTNKKSTKSKWINPTPCNVTITLRTLVMDSHRCSLTSKQNGSTRCYAPWHFVHLSCAIIVANLQRNKMDEPDVM